MQFRELTPEEVRALCLASKEGILTIRSMMHCLTDIPPEKCRRILGALNSSGFVRATGRRRTRARLFEISETGLSALKRVVVIKSTTA